MFFFAFASFMACTPKADDTSSPVDADADADTDTDTDSDTDSTYVLVPASTFVMGSPLGQRDNGYPAHGVILTHAYFVGVTEVTQGQFQAVLGYNPSNFTDCDSDGQGPDNCPVEQVTWHESAAYSNAMSDAAGLQECYTCTGSGATVECDVGMNPYECDGYRLLTEAEWEGAARCGTDTRYAGSGTSTEVAWTAENSDDRAHAIAGLAPNACGLYDMSGNLREWTQDWNDDYRLWSVTDPIGAESGTYRVVRGGSWRAYAAEATTSYRSGTLPDYASYYGGFRLARTSP